jgi:two-component system LytT family response regulator
MRVLLVDDEQAARDRLRQLLQPFDDVEVVGEAEDGEQALEAVLSLRPDLVFLDIQMPGCNGLEVAASLPSPRPHIVFCTAYDEYAVDAFELHAVDYLLKPVNRARLAKSIERLRSSASPARTSGIDDAGRAAGRWPTRFLARRRNSFCVVPADEVLMFVSEGGQTKLQTDEYHGWMQPTLADLESRLDPEEYFRVSRSTIVKLNRIREVHPLTGGYGEVTLTNGAKLEVSRRRFKDLLARLA